MIRLKNWTLSTGLRFDHYGLLVNQSAWSPRAGVAYHVPKTDVVFRASYDRIFQTPAFENLLVSSSPTIASLSDQVLRLPVQPARGNYYEAGFAKAFLRKLRLDANFYRRDYTNYPDDDLLLNTGVSFPITFSKAEIYGVEVKLEVSRWGPLSGYVSWSNMRGNGHFPVTGGLFLGDEAAQAVSATSGVFPVSQDQRKILCGPVTGTRSLRAYGPRSEAPTTAACRWISTELTPRQPPSMAKIFWIASISPITARATWIHAESVGRSNSPQAGKVGSLRFQADVINVTNQLNVINFAGLFSGTGAGGAAKRGRTFTFRFLVRIP